MESLKFIVVFCLFTLVSCNRDTSTYALIETNLGNMKMKLYDFTPKHKANFIKLAKEGYYDGLLFHRCVPGFMAQGGDPDSRNAAPGIQLGNGGPGYTIPAEIGAPHFRGAVAAARMPNAGNPQKASSGSQFFIVQGSPQTDSELKRVQKSRGITYTQAQIDLYKDIGGYPSLDTEYSVFGEIVEGMEVVDKMNEMERDPANRPVTDIKMKIKILK